MTTFPVTKYYYIIETVYFIYRLFILFISALSFSLFLYSVKEIYERLPTCQYEYFVLYYVLYYQHGKETLDSFMPHSYLRYKKGPDLNLPPPPQFTIFSYAPVVRSVLLYIRNRYPVSRPYKQNLYK